MGREAGTAGRCGVVVGVGWMDAESGCAMGHLAIDVGGCELCIRRTIRTHPPYLTT